MSVVADKPIITDGKNPFPPDKFKSFPGVVVFAASGSRSAGRSFAGRSKRRPAGRCLSPKTRRGPVECRSGCGGRLHQPRGPPHHSGRPDDSRHAMGHRGLTDPLSRDRCNVWGATSWAASPAPAARAYQDCPLGKWPAAGGPGGCGTGDHQTGGLRRGRL